MIPTSGGLVGTITNHGLVDESGLPVPLVDPKEVIVDYQDFRGNNMQEQQQHPDSYDASARTYASSLESHALHVRTGILMNQRADFTSMFDLSSPTQATNPDLGDQTPFTDSTGNNNAKAVHRSSSLRFSKTAAQQQQEFDDVESHGDAQEDERQIQSPNVSAEQLDITQNGAIDVDSLVKLQAAFRGFLERKKIVSQLHQEVLALQAEMAQKDIALAKSSAELKLRNGMIEQLGKNISALRKQVTEMSSSYESKLTAKQKQIEDVEKELQASLSHSQELRQRLENSTLEMMKLTLECRESRDDSEDGKASSNSSFQHELEEVRLQLSTLRSTREADTISLNMKDREILELRSQLADVRRSLEADLAAKNKELDGLRPRHGNRRLTINTTGLPSSSGGSLSASASFPGASSTVTLQQLSLQQDVQQHQQAQHQQAHHQLPTPTSSSLPHSMSVQNHHMGLGAMKDEAASAQNGSGGNGNGGRGKSNMVSTMPSRKSIWAPVDRNPVGFFTNGDVTAQSVADALYESGGSNSPPIEPSLGQGNGRNNPVVNGGGAYKSIWAANVDADFTRSLASPTDVPFPDSPSDAMFVGDFAGMHHGGPGDYCCKDQSGLSPKKSSHMIHYETNTSANLRYLVDKIVKTNDQPASLLLQQKLKSATPEIKEMIFEAIMQQAISLMKNRFGNFLMQRCLEFGTPQHVRLIGETMRGKVYELACDRFGCHVVQKAFDTVDDELKTALISELFRAIPETITHRFACHVWQRVFETRWGSQEPPAVMQYVDSALKGQWHLIANDENGSLVVQCIFENCSEQEKAPLLCEILAHVVDIAKGQWGNWVVQHILEHGSTPDRAYVLKVVTHNMYPMSIDQYASKVVEKALKTSSRREIYDMIERVISPTLRENGRPYFLDMMNHQYGNYVVQHILNLAEPHQREVCVRILSPHLSTLRGSKYGQRVATIVEKILRSSSSSALSQIAASNAAAASATSASLNMPYNTSMGPGMGMVGVNGVPSNALTACPSTMSLVAPYTGVNTSSIPSTVSMSNNPSNGAVNAPGGLVSMHLPHHHRLMGMAGAPHFGLSITTSAIPSAMSMSPTSPYAVGGFPTLPTARHGAR
ncbi:hypothetical protein HK102_009891 [Quaeritorhiza haematococci]|nr:hypothetical protein HK102_009891 [Quaeritorhiza haematococci]